MKNILLTGGTGFIGSHIFIQLIKCGYYITIIDSNINSSEKVIKRISDMSELTPFFDIKKFKFYKGDIRNEILLNDIFLSAKEQNNEIDAVIHLAGLKAVRESKIKPLEYWESNVSGSIILFKVMQKFNCYNLIFSSSATIYSSDGTGFFDEDTIIKPINPYGNTKAAIEQILRDLFDSSPNLWRIACLRYFNPIGAHPSGNVCEDPKGIPNNIFPVLLKVASREIDCLEVFGNDWETPDGTGIRDYVHVLDIADGHIMVLKYLMKNPPKVLNLNLGTGVGKSVMELINTFEEVNQIKINYVFSNRREGDIPRSVANIDLAKKLIGWDPKNKLADMCKDGWRSKLNNQ